MSSSRFPGKSLAEVAGIPLIDFMYNRVKKSKCLDQVIVVTSTDSTDDVLVKYCGEKKIPCFRGSLDDVLERFYKAWQVYPSQHIVRLTGDCPLIEPEVIDKVITQHLEKKCDYSSNVEPASFPDGLDTEVFTSELLTEAYEKADLAIQREHVTPYIRNKSGIKKSNYKAPQNLSDYRLTVDYVQDLTDVNKIVNELGMEYEYKTLESFLLKNSDVFSGRNSRNEGMIKSMKESLNEKKLQLKNRYQQSTKRFEEASKVIPLASQTFSKSITQLPLGAAPLFIEEAKGSKIKDIDGNEYIDFVNSLACITLGYGHEKVVSAVKKQLDNGTIFSLPGTLEQEVAQSLIDLVPCAEMVRFGKNGTDVTSAAVRLSRAYTKKNIVLSCGYHGWQDWYIGVTTKNLGVPEEVSRLTKTFQYNNIESLKKLVNENKGDIACIIMEPMNVEYPATGFLEQVREIATKENIVLIFDEMVTGFRFSNGGAQELFGVIPDLACFGKGIANGYPLSAIAGKKEIMTMMEDIFFSGTFGGELLSLAAGKETMSLLASEKIIDSINRQGEYLIHELNSLIEEYSLQEYFDVKGHPTWSFFIIKESEHYEGFNLKTFFLQEMLLNGIYTIGTHNMSYAHTKDDIDKLIGAYRSFFNIFKELINNNEDVKNYLCCDPIKPLFKVR